MRTIRVLTGRHIVCQHLLNVCKFREGPTRLQNYVKGASLFSTTPALQRTNVFKSCVVDKVVFARNVDFTPKH